MIKKSEIDPDDTSVITTLRICFGDGCMHAGTGALVGTLLSIVLCNRKRWPIVTGLGVGSGYSWANCQ
ncbi:hypothetical protein PYW07_004173 [Mythimna separata]|uniref:MICOS complex subunit MIC10 n=1 Tax=Mythimna separata TaxID=271217 RepID=A0AAD7YPK6_MYTSE|nr:hypothetical protein PYW07_004173 [Mythimna separata]